MILQIEIGNSKIASLSNKLSLIERMAIESQRGNLTEASKQCVIEMKLSGEEQTTLKEEILRLQMQLSSMGNEFRDSETSLRKVRGSSVIRSSSIIYNNNIDNYFSNNNFESNLNWKKHI